MTDLKNDLNTNFRPPKEVAKKRVAKLLRKEKITQCNTAFTGVLTDKLTA